MGHNPQKTQTPNLFHPVTICSRHRRARPVLHAFEIPAPLLPTWNVLWTQAQVWELCQSWRRWQSELKMCHHSYVIWPRGRLVPRPGTVLWAWNAWFYLSFKTVLWSQCSFFDPCYVEASEARRTTVLNEAHWAWQVAEQGLGPRPVFLHSPRSHLSLAGAIWQGFRKAPECSMPFDPVLSKPWISPKKTIMMADKDVFIKMFSNTTDLTAEIWEKNRESFPYNRILCNSH